MPDAAYCDWKGWHSDAFGALTPEQRGFYDRELLPLLASAEAGGVDPLVLEIGFGNGSLLTWCQQRGLRYAGVEANPDLVARAQAAGVAAASSLGALGLAPASVACAVAIDVLEHVRSDALVPLFRELHGLVRPSGAVLARFPNGDSPFGLAYQHGDLTHVTSIGSRLLSQVAAQTQWRVRAYRWPLVDRRGLGLVSWLTVSLGLLARRVAEVLASRLFLSGQALVLAPNAVAVLTPRPAPLHHP